jgi:uncharacterized membrane protein YbhN (UPF0104 family)
LKNPAAKFAVRLLQWAVVAGIIAYLVHVVRSNDSFDKLASSPKQWHLLAAAVLAMLAGVTITIIRWHWLMRGLDLPVRMGDSLRLGYLGYLLTFVSAGVVGGDLFKAIFVARELHGHRAEAVATVVVDRLFGLYGIFLLATISILATGAWQAETNEQVRAIYRATFICAAVGTGGLSLLLLPGAVWHGLSQAAARVPKAGTIGVRLLKAVQMYRSRFGVVLAAIVLTLVAQTLFAVAFHWVSAGLLENHPSLAAHMVMVPIAMITGILPLPMNGLGAFETAIEFLYQKATVAISGASAVVPAKGVGVLVSLGNRIVSMAVALVGVVLYLLNRREVAEVMHEAEAETKAGHTLLEAEDELPS